MISMDEYYRGYAYLYGYDRWGEANDYETYEQYAKREADFSSDDYGDTLRLIDDYGDYY